MIKTQSKIGHNYATIKVTQSRINKGLLAIPVALIDWFPKKSTQVKIFLNDLPTPQLRNFTPYDSSSRECRIGGLARWFKENQIKHGDEIVIQRIDKDNFIFRLINETKFIVQTKKLQEMLDASPDEEEAKDNLIKIAQWTNENRDITKLNEFQRLATELRLEQRKRIVKKEAQVKEQVPTNLKVLIGEIYLGHCQVCDFWFLKRDGTPYYEIHHIDDALGNYLQNLLLVCGNCHNQFTYAMVWKRFKIGWLSRVRFNDRTFDVNQIVFTHKFKDATKEVFVLESFD